MIDWCTVLVPVTGGHTLQAGRVMAVSAEGEIEWQIEKRLSVRGSHESTVTLRRTSGVIFDGEAIVGAELEVAGSPAKFLQGHNAFGSNDLRGQVEAMVRAALTSAGFEVAPVLAELLELGGLRLLRVDINESFETGSRNAALAWIRAAARHGRVSHRRDGGLLTGDTVSWGRKSRYWQLKAYCKGQEMQAKGHRLPLALQGRGVEAWADSKLRVELQLNARYLRMLTLDQVSDWQMDTPARVYSQHLAKLTLSGDVTMTRDDLVNLPKELRRTYELWAAGVDVRPLSSQRTFYRHRKALLPYGVDLAVSQAGPPSNVVPLIRYIEAKPVGVPEWAIGTDLLYQPRRA